MMKHKSATFLEFVWIWNQMQGYELPAHHKKIGAFLEKCLKDKNCSGALLMAFRNSGKSTMVGLFCAWALYKNPNARILILSADYELAKKMVRNIKRIIERHPLTKGLKPKAKDQWASDRFTINRSKELRDPSVLARGIGANITGARADLIVCDDVEVPKNCDSAGKRQELRQRLGELDFILVPSGMILYVGTPHTKNTIYDVTQGGFLQSFERLAIPILLADGSSAWPERFPLCKIESVRQRAGPLKFQSQMMLRPVELSESRLDAERLRFFADMLDYRQSNNAAVLRLAGEKMVAASAWWDPSFGRSEKTDRSVFACTFFDDIGNAYVYDIAYLQVANEANAAEEQCEQIAKLAEAYHLPSLAIETNGIGKFLPELLKRVLCKRAVRCAVLGVHSTKPKAERIIEALDARVANGSVLFHERIRHTPFMEEIQNWRPDLKNMHDDGLDAVAGSLLNAPVRFGAMISRTSFASPDWRYGNPINNLNLNDIKI